MKQHLDDGKKLALCRVKEEEEERPPVQRSEARRALLLEEPREAPGGGGGVGGTLRAEARCEGLCKPVEDSNFPLKAKGSFVLKTFKPKVCLCVCVFVLEREREKRFQFYKDLLGV